MNMNLRNAGEADLNNKRFFIQVTTPPSLLKKGSRCLFTRVEYNYYLCLHSILIIFELLDHVIRDPAAPRPRAPSRP